MSMRFIPSAIAGIVIVELEPVEDERGFFARTHDHRQFAAHGLNGAFVEGGISFTKQRGTIRGVHWQAAPSDEAKLVRCVRGRIFDVAVDLRPASPTYLRHVSVELTADNRRALFVSEGCGHGLQTLEDDVEVHYELSASYAPELARGVRWDDPAIAIRWPLQASVVSERDRSWPWIAGGQA